MKVRASVRKICRKCKIVRRRGVVRVADGRVVSVGTEVPADAVDLGHTAILPALQHRLRELGETTALEIIA